MLPFQILIGLCYAALLLGLAGYALGLASGGAAASAVSAAALALTIATAVFGLGILYAPVAATVVALGMRAAGGVGRDLSAHRHLRGPVAALALVTAAAFAMLTLHLARAPTVL